MDPFKTVSKVSIPAIIFGVLVMLLGWLMTTTSNSLVQLQLGEAALVFLSLFFYSLIMNKMEEIEEKIKIVSAGRKKPAKLVP